MFIALRYTKYICTVSKSHGQGGVLLKTLTFRGGIHPDDCKKSTQNDKIIEIMPSKIMVYPVLQHIGAPCKPIVNVGDDVLKGQKIADSDAFVSAPIHSSVSGKVIAIEKRRHPNGNMTESIVIENDNLYRLSPDIYRRSDLDKLSKDEKLKIIREAGVVGLGGAAFPTHIKLNPNKKIDYVIVNGAECEPYLTSDHRVMLETASDVVEGLKLIMGITGAKEGFIAIEENKPDAILKMQEAVKNEKNISVKVLKTKYPQGSEKHIIYAVCKREVPSGSLPADVGVIVDNIDTCTAVYFALTMRRPVMSRVVTVSGSAIDTPRNFRVPVGTDFMHVIENAGGFIGDVSKVIMGGPMMGIAQFDLSVPTVKATSAILAFDKSETEEKEVSPCIRCGECVKRCPMRLMPLYLNMYAASLNLDMCEKYNITDCIECGVCSYLCQSNQNPLQNIKRAKPLVIARQKTRQ